MDKTNLKSTFLWDIAEKIISYDTVSFKSNSACSNMIANLLEDIGFTVKIEQFDDNGHMKEQVIAWAGPPVEDGIILSGHIDTVPFENQPGWTKNALELTLEEDKIFGRGSCDMKLFIVHCIQALKELDLNKLKKPIVCIFTADEEVGCLGAKRLLTKLETILDNMPIPKRALIGEPTNFNIINTHKGIVHFDINIAGKGGHSSRPDLGVNAISPLGEIISLIEATNFEYQQKLDPVLKKLFPDFPYNYLHMAQVDGGIAVNMIPEQCRLTISYRCFPTDPPYKLLNDLKF